MGNVLAGFFTIWAIIGLGALLAHTRVFDASVQRVLARVSFLVGLPCLLFSSLRTADLERIFSLNVVVSMLAILASLASYAAVATWVWHRPLGHQVIGGFASCYVNANNMGLPIAAYVLDDTSWVAPILMIQMLFLQPLGLAILDALRAKREGHPTSWWYNASLPVRNPLTLGVLLGLIVNLVGLHLPGVLADTIDVVGGMSVPCMLLAFGISLRLGPLPGSGNVAETTFVSVLKVIVQPVVAFILARYVFGLEAATTIAVLVMAGLPTAQNVFVFAMRGDESVQLARDAVFITSFASIPAITVLVSLAEMI